MNGWDDEPEIDTLPPRRTIREYHAEFPVEGRWVFIGEWCWNDPLVEATANTLREIKGGKVSVRCYAPGLYSVMWKHPDRWLGEGQ